jgi:hypothetical protein
MDKFIGGIFLGLLAYLGFIVLAILVSALFAFPVMWLWNGCLVALITGISPIHSFLQAWGLMLLCAILIKGK